MNKIIRKILAIIIITILLLASTTPVFANVDKMAAYITILQLGRDTKNIEYLYEEAYDQMKKEGTYAEIYALAQEGINFLKSYDYIDQEVGVVVFENSKIKVYSKNAKEEDKMREGLGWEVRTDVVDDSETVLPGDVTPNNSEITILSDGSIPDDIVNATMMADYLRMITVKSEFANTNEAKIFYERAYTQMVKQGTYEEVAKLVKYYGKGFLKDGDSIDVATGEVIFRNDKVRLYSKYAEDKMSEDLAWEIRTDKETSGNMSGTLEETPGDIATSDDKKTEYIAKPSTYLMDNVLKCFGSPPVKCPTEIYNKAYNELKKSATYEDILGFAERGMWFYEEDGDFIDKKAGKVVFGHDKIVIYKSEETKNKDEDVTEYDENNEWTIGTDKTVTTGGQSKTVRTVKINSSGGRR